MIKLTTTQAKAVAVKIREKILKHNADVRENLKQEFMNSEAFKIQQREAHEIAVAMWQSSLKLNLNFGLAISGNYSSSFMFKEEDIESVEDKICNSIASKYLNKNDNTVCPPSEDDLVTDLIFESMMCEDLQQLMDKFVNKYIV